MTSPIHAVMAPEPLKREFLLLQQACNPNRLHYILTMIDHLDEYISFTAAFGKDALPYFCQMSAVLAIKERIAFSTHNT